MKLCDPANTKTKKANILDNVTGAQIGLIDEKRSRTRDTAPLTQG
jgi:hypothetical protein